MKATDDNNPAKKNLVSKSYQKKIPTEVISPLSLELT